MKRLIKKGAKFLRGATGKVKRFFHLGGNPAVPAAMPPMPAPVVAAPPKRRSRSRRKGPIRRMTNAVRRVGKRVRNSFSGIFSKKKRTRRKRPIQRGSAEVMPANAMMPASPMAQPMPQPMPQPNAMPPPPMPTNAPPMPQPIPTNAPPMPQPNAMMPPPPPMPTNAPPMPQPMATNAPPPTSDGIPPAPPM